MAKRVLALILIICCLLTACPALADNARRGSVVVNKLGSERRVMVFVDGKDVLFSAEDLAEFSDHQLQIKNNKVTLQRGRKTLTVDVNKNELTCSLSKGKTKLEKAVVKADGTFYISGAQLLNWLNIRVGYRDGKLFVSPNPASIWDITGKITDDGFSTKACAQIMGISEKKVKKILDRKALKQRDYYDLLDDFFLDQSMTDTSTALLREQMDIVTNLGKYADFCIGLFYPPLSGKTSFEDLGKIGEKLVRLTVYASLFMENNSTKLEIMESLHASAKKEGNKALSEAALDVYYSYMSFWRGLLYRGNDFNLKDTLLELVPENLDSYDLIIATDLLVVDDRLSSQWLNRYPGYNKLAKLAEKECKNGPNTKDFGAMKHYVYHAMLYYYAAEQCYRGMIQYMIEQRYAADKIDQMHIKAGRAEALYGHYLTALAYLSSDRVEHSHHANDYELNTRAFMSHLDIRSGESSAVHIPEMMNGLAALKAMDIPSLHWTVLDNDADGEDEIFLWGYCGKDDFHESIMVLDGSTLGIYTDRGDTQADTAQSRRNNRFYIVEEYSVPYLFEESLYEWDGDTWSPFISQKKVSGVSADYFFNGVSVSEEQHKTAKKSLDLSSFDLECPDYDDVYQPGSPQTILKEVDNYYMGYSVGSSVYPFDLNGDGTRDRLILLPNAFNAFQRGMRKDLCTGTETPFKFKDKALTVITAEDVTDSVRFRVGRLPMKNGQFELQPDHSLIVDGVSYIYQPFGLPFQEGCYPVYEDEDESGFEMLIDLLGATPRKVEEMVDFYSEWGEPNLGVAEGEFYGEHVSITYARYYDPNVKNNVVCELSLNNFNNSSVPVCQDTVLNQPAIDIMAALPVLSDWGFPEPLFGYEGDVFGYTYENVFIHPKSGVLYKVTILCSEMDGMDSPVSIMFSPFE